MILGGGNFYVYTMGKVGSNSVKGALDSWLGLKSRHLHDVVKKGSSLNYRPALAKDNDELVGLFSEEDRVFNVLTMVREPVKKNISQFFQDLDRRYKVDITALSYDELLNRFLNMDKHFMPIDWFDVNILENFGIDVFSDSYKEVSGHKVYCNNRCSLLCLKSESDNFSKLEALRYWVDDEKFPEIVDRNVSEEKYYSSVYRDFLSKVKLPESYVLSVYDNKYTKFFYPDVTVEHMLEKWC